MKKEEFIKLGVNEELALKLEETWAEELRGFIPRSRFDEVNEALKSQKAIVLSQEEQLKELKKSAGAGEELKQKIAEMEKANEASKAAFEEKIKQLKIENAVEAAIRTAGGRNVKAVRALIDIDGEKISVNEKGELVGLDIKGQLEKLKGAEDSSFLFSRSSGFRGAQPGRSNSGDADVFPEKGSYEDMAAWFEAHTNSN